MPLLHIELKGNNEDKQLDSELVAQHLTLIKATCTYRHLKTNTLEAIAVDLPFISPLDYISSDSSRHIVLPFNFGQKAEDIFPNHSRLNVFLLTLQLMVL